MTARKPTFWIFIGLLVIAGSIYKFRDQQQKWDRSISQNVVTGLNRYSEILALLARSQSVHDWSVHSFVNVESLFNQVVLRESALQGVFLVDASGKIIGRNTHNADGLYLNEIDRASPVKLESATKRAQAFGKFGALQILKIGDSSLQLHKEVVINDRKLGEVVATVNVLPLAAQSFTKAAPFKSFSVDLDAVGAGPDSLSLISKSLKYRLTSQVFFQGLGTAVLTVLIAISGFFILAVTVSSLLVAPLSSLMKSIRNVSAGNYAKIDVSRQLGPMKWLLQMYNRQIESIAEASNLRLEIESARRLSALAKQVSHDIRSPLTVLKMLIPGMGAKTVEEKQLVEQAIDRVGEVADDLLKRDRLGRAHPAPATSFTCILNEIVDEKEFEFRGRSYPLIIERQICEGLEARVEQAGIKRVLSNLLNNSAEALLPAGGSIVVRAFEKEDKVLITVEDSGKGIPPEILERLGEPGFSYGKSGGESGNGLGLSHARSFVRQFSGDLHIASTLGRGTSVTLEFPGL